MRVGAGVEQQTDHGGIGAEPGGTDQRRPSKLIPGMDGGAGVQQLSRHGGVRVQSCRHQRGGPAGVGAAYVRSRANQRLQHCGVPVVRRGGHERGFSAGERRHRQRPPPYQRRDSVEHGVMAGDVEERSRRGRAFLAQRGTGGEQHLRHRRIRVERRRQHQGTPAVCIPRGHVRAGIQQRLSDLGIGVEVGGQHQCRDAPGAAQVGVLSRAGRRANPGGCQCRRGCPQRGRIGFGGSQQLEHGSGTRDLLRCGRAAGHQQRGQTRQDETPAHAAGAAAGGRPHRQAAFRRAQPRAVGCAVPVRITHHGGRREWRTSRSSAAAGGRAARRRHGCPR